MMWKFNTYYIVTKGSEDGIILSGDTLMINFSKCKDKNFQLVGEYELFLPPRPTQKSFFGSPPLSSVLYFNTKEELLDSLKNIEVIYDIDLVQKLINNKQNEIDELKLKHEIL